jgi:hypothetical protein
LQPAITQLIDSQCAVIVSGELVATEKGRNILTLFMQRYSDFLNTMDIYAAVDLTTGEFATSECFFTSMSEEYEEVFRQDSRWEDLRVAVADFKGLDPVEIVFMSFLNENRFDTTKPGWQFELVSDLLWQEILKICNTALQADDLAYDDVPGINVLQDVIKQGTAILADIFDEMHQMEYDETVTTTVTEVITVEEPMYGSYYDPYYDPYYVAPYWNSYYYW